MTAEAGPAHAFTPRHLAVVLPDAHRFPMTKYDMVAARLEADGWRLEPSPCATWETLAVAHDARYLAAVRDGALDARAERRLGFPQSRALVDRSRASTGGTVAALARALERGLGVHLAGGTHHAFADRGEGFCVFNDLVVAARLLRSSAPRALVIDLDVHQGNGTAALAAGDPDLLTYSVHGERNYPFVKERSDLDRALPDGIDDDGYLAVVADDLPRLLAEHEPDVVLYQAGVDVLAGDRFGRMALSIDGVEERDRLVARACAERGIPVAYTLGGGYHADVEVTVEAHRRGLAAIDDAWRTSWRVAGRSASRADVC